jgi:hypothetical protein
MYHLSRSFLAIHSIMEVFILGHYMNTEELMVTFDLLVHEELSTRQQFRLDLLDLSPQPHMLGLTGPPCLMVLVSVFLLKLRYW